MEEIINPLIESLIDAIREQDPFKMLSRTSRRFKVSRLAESLRKQIRQEYNDGRSLLEVLREKIASVNSKYELCIPTSMFDHLDHNKFQTEVSDAQCDDEGSDPLATPQEQDPFEYPKGVEMKEASGPKRKLFSIEKNYFERSRELYFAQNALEESEAVNKKLRMKEEVTSGLVSRDVLEQSEGICNARARSIAAIATLDRRLLTNEKLSSYGIMMISDADIDASVSKKIGSGPRSILFKSLYKEIPVAKKKLMVRELARLSTEYLLLQLLGSHPSIPHAFGLIFDSTECSLVESYIEGKLVSRFRFNDSIALGVCAVRIIEAVGHIHNRGVIHNNLQPCHILIQDSLMPVITGFGHACLVSDGYIFSQARASQLGEGCMQPKSIVSRTKPTSVASDMYCLGQLLSQMRLCEESTKIKRIHDWISEFASFCRSHLGASSPPSDKILFKHAYDLIEILGKIQPDLLG